MPRQGKSRRVAARQTQMGQKKRKQVPGPSGVPVPTDAPLVKEDGDGNGASAVAERRPDVARPHPIETQRPSPARRGDHRPSVYSYVRPELKRIMWLAGAIIAILISLSFVLG